jgi:hypothetical protein
MAASGEKEEVEAYLDNVAKLDSIIDYALNSGPYAGNNIELLKSSREELRALNVPKDAHHFHALLIDKYDPIIKMVYMADKGIKEKEANSGDVQRKIMGYWRKEFQKVAKALTPTLYEAEEEFDRLIRIHDISAQERDVNFHGLAVKKVNIHVNVIDAEGRPIQGALVRGGFFQDQVVNKIKKSAHNGLTDSQGYCLLSGRDDLYVDVRITTQGYMNGEERVLVRGGKDKVLKIVLKKEE